MNEKKNLSNYESNLKVRKELQSSLIVLMRNKNFQNITITEIIEMAGTSRNAFYRNYESKEDILKDFSFNVIEIIVQSLQNTTFKSNHKSWFNFLFHLIKNNHQIFELLLKANLTDLASAYIIESKNLNFSVHDHYKISAFKSGLNAVILQWIKNGMKESCKEMASICLDLFPQVHLILDF